MRIASIRLLKKYYPDQSHPFHKILSQFIIGRKIVLDAGCGDGSIYHYHFSEVVPFLVGIDLREDLHLNRQIHVGINASIEMMPFANASFDFIFSRFVFEHLRNPKAAFSECYRVLKPGGILLLLTPNKYHYFPLVGHIVPHRLQKWFASLVNYRPEDTFRTYYRANCSNDILRYSDQAGLSLELLLFHEPAPFFLSFSPLTLLPAILYERIINKISILAGLRAHIIAMFSKK